jgi:tetratricopeptide (TPR) repeat protein
MENSAMNHVDTMPEKLVDADANVTRQPHLYFDNESAAESLLRSASLLVSPDRQFDYSGDINSYTPDKSSGTNNSHVYGRQDPYADPHASGQPVKQIPQNVSPDSVIYGGPVDGVETVGQMDQSPTTDDKNVRLPPVVMNPFDLFDATSISSPPVEKNNGPQPEEDKPDFIVPPPLVTEQRHASMSFRVSPSPPPASRQDRMSQMHEQNKWQLQQEMEDEEANFQRLFERNTVAATHNNDQIPRSEDSARVPYPPELLSPNEANHAKLSDSSSRSFETHVDHKVHDQAVSADSFDFQQQQQENAMSETHHAGTVQQTDTPPKLPGGGGIEHSLPPVHSTPPTPIATFPFPSPDAAPAISSPEFESDEHLISHYSEVASHHLSLGQYILAMKQFQCILAHSRDIVENSPKECEQVRFQYIIADTLNNIGVMHEMKGEYEYGLQACKEALRIYKQMGHTQQGEQQNNKGDYATPPKKQQWQQNVTRTSCNIAQMTTARKSYIERRRLHQSAYDLFLEGKAIVHSQRRMQSQGYEGSGATCVTNIHGSTTRGGSTIISRSTFGRPTQLLQTISYYTKVLSNERSTLGKTHPQVGRTMICLSHVYCTLHQFDEAVRSIHMAVAILKNGLGESHPNVATAYAALGRIHYSMGEYDDAIHWLKMAGVIQRQALVVDKNGAGTGEGGADHADGTRSSSASLSSASTLAATEEEVVLTHEAVATSWIAMGVVYVARREIQKALECHREALSIYLEIEENTTREDGRNYYNRRCKKLRKEAAKMDNYLGQNGKEQQKVMNYDDLYIYPVQMVDENGHTRDSVIPGVAIAWAWVGEVYRMEDDFPRALEALDHARLILTERVGARHISVATILTKLGIAYRMSHRYGKAKQALHEAIAIQRARFGSFHDTLAASMVELGEVWENTGELSRAIDTYREALSTQRRALPSMHKKQGRVLVKIGRIYETMEQLDDALVFYTEAMRIYKSNIEDHTQSTVDEDEDMKVGRDRLIGIQIALAGGEEQMILEDLNRITKKDKIAEGCMHKGNLGEAFELYNESLEFKRKMLGDEHLNVGLALRQVAHIKERQMKYEEAHILYTECLRIYRINGLTFQHHLIKDVLAAIQKMDSGSMT